MSHVATIDIEIKDLDCLAKAAQQLGLELVNGQKTYRWYGRSVGDYPLPTGFTAEDLGKCEHAIRIPGNTAAYEIGVVARRDGKPGYTLQWDFYCGGYGMEKIVGQNASKLRQEYAAQVATKHMQRQGYRVTRSIDAKGNLQLVGA
jgi:hypothetical protein